MARQSAFQVAASKGAQAARTREQYHALDSIPKRVLIEAALHLAALAHESGSYDTAIAGDGAFDRLMEEIAALKRQGMV